MKPGLRSRLNLRSGLYAGLLAATVALSHCPDRGLERKVADPVAVPAPVDPAPAVPPQASAENIPGYGAGESFTAEERSAYEVLRPILAKRNALEDGPFFMALIEHESGFNPRARSKTGALGYLQVQPQAAADAGYAHQEMLDPRKNLEAGIAHMYGNIGRFDGMVVDARTGEMIPAEEARNFALIGHNLGPTALRQLLLGEYSCTRAEEFIDLLRQKAARKQPIQWVNPFKKDVAGRQKREEIPVSKIEEVVRFYTEVQNNLPDQQRKVSLYERSLY